jgi:hypothetical protein
MIEMIWWPCWHLFQFLVILVILAKVGNSRSFDKFWLFLKLGHFSHMWQFLAKFDIFVYFDYVLILMTFAIFGNCSPFWILALFCNFWQFLLAICRF